ncbi:ABC-2 type transport system ATP-binding protein [Geomicrobium halophilum]|uniref:ABC-2 type transport system ATP-binding protein n=1 Tax=Geomicrobium halophilum TaxID=549000 RepID=A0A841Q0A3_9BACL|nr:ABC-2 type transport system ATP-binding protein [Geomicrobium halophilum]
MSENKLVLHNLSKSFSSATVVKDLNLTVKQGELYGFLGPNGSGKTTTMKMICGLLEPSRGSVEVAGFDVWKHPLEAKKRLAYVPDQPLLYEKLSGEEYLSFIASVFHIHQDEFQERKDKYVEWFDLQGQLSQWIESYSHGMKQKLSLVAALIHQPDIIFLDEPTVGLDPKAARVMKNLLRELCDNDGLTVFMSTHILEIAEQMCDRIGIIRNGEWIAEGTMEQLRSKEGAQDSSLEELFLSLTSQEAGVQSMINEMKQGEEGPS